ncbi:MAG: response regulator [Bacteroidetes bacterium]|nr:response regulator [Bacteroidota bacterium]
MQQTFAPTVLIVDDDPAMLDIISRRFYENTSLGVLTIDNLKEAHSVVSENRVHLDAILSDISFTPRTQDADHDIYDGLDLIQYTSKLLPDLPHYVCSVYSKEPSYKKRAKEMGIKLINWYPKLEIDVDKPWNDIERQLYKMALDSNEELGEKAANEGFLLPNDEGKMMDWIRSSIRPTRQTYITSLPLPYRVVHPIRVICEEDRKAGLVTAEAPNLGLIIPGQGATVEDALEELADIIVEQYNDFIAADSLSIVGYAAKVFKQLRYYLAVDLN